MFKYPCSLPAAQPGLTPHNSVRTGSAARDDSSPRMAWRFGERCGQKGWHKDDQWTLNEPPKSVNVRWFLDFVIGSTDFYHPISVCDSSFWAAVASPSFRSSLVFIFGKVLSTLEMDQVLQRQLRQSFDSVQPRPPWPLLQPSRPVLLEQNQPLPLSIKQNQTKEWFITENHWIKQCPSTDRRGVSIVSVL